MQMAALAPDDLAVMPPGPGLAAALAAVDLARVPDDRMLELLRAQYRQLSHEQARTAAVLAEVGRCAGFPEQGEVHRLVAVPRARGLTTGQLAVLLRRMVIAVDPDAAARWYREGIRRRGAVAYPAADGTITPSAHGLPADEAEAACTRLQGPAARAKRAGHPGLIDQIRADLYLGLLDGRFHHLTADELITALIAGYHAEESNEPDSEDVRPAAEPAGADGPGYATPDNPAAGPTTAGPAAGPGHPAGPKPGTDRARDQRVGIEIPIGLATMLGHDEHPPRYPASGCYPHPTPAAACTCRPAPSGASPSTTARAGSSSTASPVAAHRHREGPPGGIVELHVPLSLLTELLAADRLATQSGPI